MKEGIKARIVALNILKEVTVKHRALDDILKSDKEYSLLDNRDKSFCRMLVSTCLRRYGQINDILRQALKKPDKKIKPPIIYKILQIGVTQIMFMDVPNHAAVDITVELAEICGAGDKKSFVNGVLRTVTREGGKWSSKQDIPRLNTPDWLLNEWIKDYGIATTIEIGQANMVEAPLDFTIRDNDRIDEWAEILDGNILPTGTIRRRESSGVNITNLDGFEAGAWWIQDISASLAVKIMGNINGKKIVDLCAAPGGKTMQLVTNGADVIAVDRSARRMQKLKENLDRINITANVKIEIADALAWQSNEDIDILLLDAPCSATGTIRRHPDLVHIKTYEDMEKLVDLQKRLLDNAFSKLKSGGILIYCTCSLQKDEGENRIEEFLSNNKKEAKRIPITAEEIGKIEGIINDNGDIRIMPFHLAAMGGMDGFFISRIMKL